LKLQWEMNKKKNTLVINPNFISTLRIVSMTVFSSYVMYRTFYAIYVITKIVRA